MGHMKKKFKKVIKRMKVRIRDKKRLIQKQEKALKSYKSNSDLFCENRFETPCLLQIPHLGYKI